MREFTRYAPPRPVRHTSRVHLSQDLGHARQVIVGRASRRANTPWETAPSEDRLRLNNDPHGATRRARDRTVVPTRCRPIIPSHVPHRSSHSASACLTLVWLPRQPLARFGIVARFSLPPKLRRVGEPSRILASALSQQACSSRRFSVCVRRRAQSTDALRTHARHLTKVRKVGSQRES